MKHNTFTIAKLLFENKDKYETLSDKDKEDFFFIINRNLCRQYPKQAQFLNNKIMDKSSSLDIWYQFFIKKNMNKVPWWFWFKKATKAEKRILSKEETVFLKEFDGLRDEDLKFLEKYYLTELKAETKKFRKFNKKK